MSEELKNNKECKIQLEEVTTINIQVTNPVMTVDGTDGISKTMVGFTGTISGPVLNGKILPGGIDTQTFCKGVNRLSARYMVELDDGAKVFVENNGVSYNKDDKSYFKCVPTFKTDSEKYSWLNTDIFVGTAEDAPGGLRIIVYRCA